MSRDPISGREPSLGGGSELTGREPFIGGDGSLAGLITSFDELENAPPEVLVDRLADSVPELADCLGVDDIRLRRKSALVIGLIAARRPETRDITVPLLLRVLDDALNRQDRPAIVSSLRLLGEMQDSRAAERLVALIGQVYDATRLTLGQAIQRLGETALAPLMRLFPEDHQRNQWIFAEYITLICRDAPQTHAQVAAWIAPRLLDTADNTYWALRKVANEVASMLPIEPLAATALDENRSNQERMAAYRRIAGLPDSRASAALIRLLASADRSLTLHARRRLVENGIPEDIAGILAMIESPDQDVRRDGLNIAGLRHIRQALHLAAGALADPSPAIRGEAIQTVRRIPDPRAVSYILPMLNDRAASVRRRAVDTLVFLVPYFANRLPAIEAGLNAVVLSDPSKAVRAAAAEGLAHIRNRGRTHE